MSGRIREPVRVGTRPDFDAMGCDAQRRKARHHKRESHNLVQALPTEKYVEGCKIFLIFY